MRHLLYLLSSGIAFAQPQSVEVFGLGGAMRAGGDEGSNGSAAVYGGAVMLPLRPNLALDIDLQTGRTNQENGGFSNRNRMTMINPALLWRKGSAKAYFFAGGGIGAQFEQVRFRGPAAPGPGIFQGGESSNGMTLHGRLGVVAALRSRILMRAEFCWVHRYVLPNLTFRAGIGYRF